MKIADRFRTFVRVWAPILTILFCLAVGLVSCMNKQLSVANSAKDEFLGKSIELYSPQYGEFTIKVTEVYAEWDPFYTEVTLTGPIYLKKPKDATYLGTAPGSLAISWLYGNGTGTTWFVDDLELKNPWRNASLEVNPQGVYVTEQ